MTRIIPILTVSTVTTIAFIVGVLWISETPKNGGQFWGLDGVEQPHTAALRFYKNGDRRILLVDIGDFTMASMRNFYTESCLADLEGPAPQWWISVDLATADESDLVAAQDFARDYNNRMVSLLNEAHDVDCPVLFDL